jgi:tRNA-splicing ligase RtcB
MAARIQLERVDDVRARIPRDERRGMLTDVLVFATAAVLEQVRGDLSLEQAMNVAALPGIVGSSLVMPDVHQGYGFPIGGVAAMDYEHGVVSPGGVGFDINCGVRLVRTSLSADEVRPRMRDLVNQVFRDIPCGTGGAGNVEMTPKQLNEVLEDGAAWAVSNGYGVESDLEHCEEHGRLEDADPDHVSERAKKRGLPQLGTVGSGNHFLEVQYVEAIHDAGAARSMNIAEGQVVVLIHCGSRGLGHQVCTDYLAQMGGAMKRHGISLADRQLACVPISSREGQAYLGAMRAAANFAWANRQMILHLLRESLRRVFGHQVQAGLLYDVCHNIAKRERHVVDGKKVTVLVHRKGATRAFPPGHREIPPAYRETGQPVLIPGSMGTASWILVGSDGAMRESFGSVCHGAGRLMSRTAAKKGRDARVELRKLEDAGIVARSESRDGILEEIPDAYKDVDEVIEVVHRAELARKVARLRPMGVIKG